MENENLLRSKLVATFSMIPLNVVGKSFLVGGKSFKNIEKYLPLNYPNQINIIGMGSF